MGESDFKFKQFSIKQQFCAMRVNTDAVLLGAWMSLPASDGARMLDIGTGTGVIALMAAQRVSGMLSCATIDAVEIDAQACQDAKINFDNAPWEGYRPNLYNCSIQEFALKQQDVKYDFIFSNPPYFIDSLKNPDSSKTLARHADTLTQADLLLSVERLLNPGGKFALVLPKTEAEELLRKIDFLVKNSLGKERNVLCPVRVCKVKTTERKEAKRYLMEFEYKVASQDYIKNINTINETLVMLNNGVYTNEYKKLTMDFYLYF